MQVESWATVTHCLGFTQLKDRLVIMRSVYPSPLLTLYPLRKRSMERTKEQCIEVIREACHKAVPALKELSFGCEVKFFLFGLVSMNLRYAGLSNSKSEKSVREDGRMVYWLTTQNTLIANDERGFEIIGHEPQLQHVLAAIKMEKGSREYAVNSSGEFIMSEDIYRYNYTPTLVYWNLSHGLYQQELPVLTFLAELLEKKN